MESEMIKIEALNSALADALNIDPLTEFHDPVSQNDVRMNYGLAQVYSNEGFREYLKIEIDRALKAAALRSVTLVDSAAGKARALVLKELLIKGKQAFEELQRIQALAKKKGLIQQNGNST
jgi:hypothetical protein